MPKEIISSRRLHYAFDEQTFKRFRATELKVKLATSNWERQRYFTLRERVFIDEQQLLTREQDGDDFKATAIVALASNCGMSDDVIGAVRIFQVNDASYPNLWFGGRLCVAKDYRGHRNIGKTLINTAVSRAKLLGCTHFRAYVQLQNVSYFEGLHWRQIDEKNIAGRPHKLMYADLSAYPLTCLPAPEINDPERTMA
ncbi:MSMEG_0567/Sll0786 family nitrogen starvation N-acetyltransferase [Zhongshania sp.]|jgi:putative N-acetyltransferase (TIGR04045 family)|uniref:MSMEG_0567/Sll0786 family nitrogen starvation N-acetyltransferase n=1 Tax=Zhongshania sp. TaxID=1971902 RepID=UPI0039E6D214